MSSMRKYFCTFPQNLIAEPIVSHTLGEKFGVIPNIRAASITDSAALVAVEIEGDDAAIERSVQATAMLLVATRAAVWREFS